MSDRDRWDATYAAAEWVHGRAPAALLVQLADLLPRAGRALDLAMGEGQSAVWLAERGLDVEGVDVSPVAIAKAHRLAAERGVRIRTTVADLTSYELPPAAYDLVICFHYLQRGLASAIAAALRPEGLAVLELSTLRNLTLRPRPSRPHLVGPGELAQWFPGLRLEYYREGEIGGRGQAQIGARRRDGARRDYSLSRSARPAAYSEPSRVSR